MKDKTLVTVKNLIKRREPNQKQGPSTVLGPISLTLNKGEIIGIRGKNGAGKSTLIKIIAGITKEDGGSATIFEDAKNSIGYVPQDIALYPSLTGKNNLAFWAGLHSLNGKQKNLRINWLLEQVQLSDKANIPLSDYSGGMKRRLNLAAALLTTPKIFLVDEPTVGADIESVEIMLNIMNHIKNQGAGVIFVSHRDDELERVSDRIITLDKGLCINEHTITR
jgi:ABC-2 type transport system ATP-binding protein